MNKFLKFTTILLMASAMGGCMTGCETDSTVDFAYSNAVSELRLDTESLTFGRNGGQVKVNVQSQQTLTASSDAQWLQISVGQQSAVLKSTPVTIQSETNTSGADRTAQITLNAGGQSKNLTVTQTADLVLVSTTPDVVPGEGGIVTIALRSDEPCDVIIDEAATSWIKNITTDTRALTDRQVKLEVAGHLGAERQADVTLRVTSSDGYTKVSEVVTIRQAARETTIDTEATAMGIARQMYPGWNLGNTFEGTSGSASLGDETGWQSTKTTQEVIDFVKAQGFHSVRIPCSWHRHMDANGTIDAAWINRVKEVVDYCINDGLYVLLNDHYDEGWIETKMDSYDETRAATFTSLWNQVATAFASYDEHLLLAGLNEPGADTQAKTDNLVRYEQLFIDAVRATGGNNQYRTLVVQGPSTDIDNTSKFYTTLPKDSQADRMMVEVHFYSPWNFCGMEQNESWGKMSFFWGKANHVSGSSYNSTWGEEDYLKGQFAKMKKQFFDQGIPVVIGEYGCQWRELEANQAEHDASVKLFHELTVRECIGNGCIPMVWDINYLNRQGNKGTMSILDRSGLKVWNQLAIDGINAGVAAAKWPN